MKNTIKKEIKKQINEVKPIVVKIFMSGAIQTIKYTSTKNEKLKIEKLLKNYLAHLIERGYDFSITHANL